MNPGTSTRVTRGMLKALQKRMNLQALSEESMSSTPDMTLGWLAMNPTVRPIMRPKPTTSERAKPAWTSRKSPWSTMRPMTSRTS